MRGSRRSVRAMAIRCFSPPEKRWPREPTIVSYPSGSAAISEWICAARQAASISASVADGFAYRKFSRMVVCSRYVSWLTTPTMSDRSVSAMSRRSTPSIVTRPPVGSWSRAIRAAVVLFPEPVSPTSARELPAGTSRLTSASAGGPPSSYANVTCSNRKWPRTWPRRTGLSGEAISTGRSRYSKIRANSASELVIVTLTSSRLISGRNRFPCRAVNATSVPMLIAPAANGRPAAR